MKIVAFSEKQRNSNSL